MINRDGPQGTADALRASNQVHSQPIPVEPSVSETLADHEGLLAQHHARLHLLESNAGLEHHGGEPGASVIQGDDQE